jgi:hypothetical protein
MAVLPVMRDSLESDLLSIYLQQVLKQGCLFKRAFILPRPASVSHLHRKSGSKYLLQEGTFHSPRGFFLPAPSLRGGQLRPTKYTPGTHVIPRLWLGTRFDASVQFPNIGSSIQLKS